MKLIPLTQGKFAQVDDDDYEYLMQWKWYAYKTKCTFYAARNYSISRHLGYDNNNKKPKQIGMHREIMQTPSNLDVDHIDHNGLNNQRNNLRNCSHTQNCINRLKFKKDATSNYYGVSKIEVKSYYIPKRVLKNDKNYGIRYIASIKINREQRSKRFKTEKEAAIWYNDMAKKYHGEYANLNIIL